MNPTPPIDRVYLLKKVSGLMEVKARRRTWNEFGQRLEREALPVQRAYHLVPELTDPGDGGASPLWQEAKELVFAVMASGEAEFESIRKRIAPSSPQPTPLLLSTLGVWLAGRLGVSVTITGPMTAAILYGVAESPAGWDVLLEKMEPAGSGTLPGLAESEAPC